ncbi:hypothetical protein [Paenibacillus rigui]|nr:hypothetical protein [Paenibacillus rigui]
MCSINPTAVADRPQTQHAAKAVCHREAGETRPPDDKPPGVDAFI